MVPSKSEEGNRSHRSSRPRKPLRWRHYGDPEVAPLCRPWSGAITVTPGWRHYADPGMAPYCRPVTPRPSANLPALATCCTSPKTGPLRSPRVTGVHHYYGPIRHPQGRFRSSRSQRFLVANEEPYGLPLLHSCSFPLRAATTTPAESLAAHLARFPKDYGLPRYYGGSASATTFRGLLGVHSRCGPQGPLTS